MELKEFKKWLIDNNFDDNVLFKEAMECYCNQLYRPAYMLSYMAFMEYLRNVIKNHKGIPISAKHRFRQKLHKSYECLGKKQKVKTNCAYRWSYTLCTLS